MVCVEIIDPSEIIHDIFIYQPESETYIENEYRALQFGAPHFCEKRGARRGPASKPQNLAKEACSYLARTCPIGDITIFYCNEYCHHKSNGG